MRSTMQCLLALTAAVLLAAVMGVWMRDRAVYRSGPAVTGVVVDHEVRVSGKRTRSGAHRQGRTHTSSYPIVTYVIPAQWPERAGQAEGFRFQMPADLPLGAPVPLWLSPHDPASALVDSQRAMWGLPLAVLFLGSGLVWCAAQNVSIPGSRRKPALSLRTIDWNRVGRRLLLAAVILLSLLGISFWVDPLLVFGLPCLLFFVGWLALGAGALLGRWGRALRRAPESGRDRPGALGLLVDLQQAVAAMIFIGGFFAASLVASVTGFDRTFPRQAWAADWFNQVRTLGWLSHDRAAALGRAARAGDLNAVRWLAPRVPPEHLYFALHEAVDAGHLPIVRILLERGADPDHPVAGTEPSLMVALHHRRDPSLIAALLEGGADPNLRLADGLTVADTLESLDTFERAEELLRLLTRHGADLDHRDRSGRSFLMRVIADGHPARQQFVPLLLELGADPNLAAPDGRTALDLARAHARPTAVQALLAKGAVSGRLQAGPGVTAVSPHAPVAQAARVLLEGFRVAPVAEWRPPPRSMGLSDAEAEDLRAWLPHGLVQVDGWQSADRASLRACGSGDRQQRRCVDMELAYRSPKRAVEAESGRTSPPPAWEVLSYGPVPGSAP